MATAACPRLGSCCLTTCSSDRPRVECPHSPIPKARHLPSMMLRALLLCHLLSLIVRSLQAWPSTLDSGHCPVTALPC